MVSAKLSSELKAAVDTMKKERDALDSQIALMEKTLTTLGVTVSKPRGRPAKASAAPASSPAAAEGGKRRNWSEESRARQSELMRLRWAERKQKKAKKTKTKA